MKTIFKNIMLWALPLGTIAGGATSCSDFLEVEPQNVVTLEQFWNEEADVTASIAGCYAALQSEACVSRMLVWGEFRSENIVNRGTILKDVALQRLLEENLTANNGYTDWTCFYDIINRCNIIAHYAPSVAEKDPSYSDSELAAHIAEVTAIRSLCYFYLIRTFRDVPYTEEPYLDDAREMNVPADKFDYVLDKLIASLEGVKNQAVVYYPEVTSGYAQYYQTGRITQLSIYAMLCEMYLWKQDYAKCQEYADLIIDFKKQYIDDHTYIKQDYSETNGFPLYTAKSRGDSEYYGYAFNSIFVTNNSNESIFELTYVKDNDNMASNGTITRYFGGANGSTVFTGYVKPSDFLTSEAKSTQATGLFLGNKFDGRRYENFTYNTGGDLICINKFTVRMGSVVPSPSKGDFYSYSMGSKYSYEEKNANLISHNKSNWIIYRLTDIMLLKAEALSLQIQTTEGNLTEDEQKKLDEAFSLCNSVYKRSLYEQNPTDSLKATNYKSKQDILNLVYDERHRELLFEGKRWYDLVRRSMREGNTDYMRSKVTRKSTELASTIETFLMRMDAMFWPYNLDETKVNDKLIQNPAFGSGESSNLEKI